ncbi:glutamate receptor ionotropic, kainate 2-like isoform X2 [Bradysia coprophila]|nr:glutamate receptor ionotropic, kainate 2-like isoform X2 [Bradysia coprophila]XP_037025794.1 glutamate receptor ionotropic, kainate 2-like isoform X2 [Bradysia coprophila]
MHDPQDSPITIRQLPPDTDDYMPFLKEIKASTEKRMIIDCSPEKVTELLKQAIIVNMTKDYQSYIITSLDSHMLDFPDLKSIESNITTLRIMNLKSLEVEAAVHDWRQDAKKNQDYTVISADRIKTEAALFNDAARVFSTAFRESSSNRTIYPSLLRCTGKEYGDDEVDYESKITHSGKWEYGMQILQTMDQITELGMTGRIVFDGDGKRKDFYMEILELSKLGDGFKKIATMDPKHVHINYTRTEAEITSQVAQVLQNKIVTVVALRGKPYLDYRTAKEGEVLVGNDKYEGYSKDLIDSIAIHLNFTYKFVLEPNNAYGSYNKDTKKWNGLIRFLLDGKADMAICDLTITYERRSAVDFTMPFMTLGISILYAKPKKESPGLFSFMYPLSTTVWLLMAIAYLCLSILLYFLAMIAVDDWQLPAPVATGEASSSQSESSDESDSQLLETIWNMHNWIWLVAGSIMQQGCDILPRAISTRVTAGLWWFFALIVISSYTANLAAFLTQERMEESIENAEDLAKQSEIKYGAVIGGSTMAFFKNSNHSTYQRMWTAMESASPSVFAENNAEGIDRVLNGNRKYAFLMESTSIDYTTARECNLMNVGTWLDSKGYGIAMPMDSPYRTLISQAVLRLQEGGKLQQLKKKWWEGENACPKDEKSEDVQLKMGNVGGCFLVLLGGIGIAILLGIYEFFWNINKMSVERKVPRWQIFKEEIKFAVDLRKTKKPVAENSSEKGSLANMSTKSIDTGRGLRSGYQIGLERINNDLM